jgi:glycosyltransferase involved in cell wall biosynthesis
MKSLITLSVVVPVYNSATMLPELIQRLEPVLVSVAGSYEVVLVNDGSRDASWDVVLRLAADHGWIRGINMMRNYGQHNALLCGIREARYDVIVTMDDDLQHPPEEIPRLLSKLAEGHDVVYGSPQTRASAWWRNFFSVFIRLLLIWVTGLKNLHSLSAFRALRTELRTVFASYHSSDVIIDVLLAWGTTRFASIPVTHAPRKAGVSNYTFKTLFNTAMVVLTGFSTTPLRIASFVGFSFMFFGVSVFVYVLYVYLVLGSLPGFTFLASIISLFSGAQLFALGILGEYMAKIFTRSMSQPPYIVRETT